MNEQIKLAEEQAEQLRFCMAILTRSIAHDLRSPLACVDLYTKILAEELGANAAPKVKDLLERLKKVFVELNRTIDVSLSSLTQTVKGVATDEQLIECHISSCMEKVLTHYPFRDHKKNLVHWNNKNSFVFLGKPVYFYQIIYILLKNALDKIQQKGKGEIFVESDMLGEHNLLRVKDTAGGVTSQMITNIFNTTKAEGTSVSLAFSQFAMRSIGGDLICHVVDGDCIEFVLSFPQIKNEGVI